MIDSKELELAAGRLQPQDLAGYLEENIAVLFSSESISSYYGVLKGIDFSSVAGNMPRLILAWMAFLCGDNAKLFEYIQGFDELRLMSSRESSLFYSLKAMSLSMLQSPECLRYAKLALDVLDGGEEGFYTGSARLNYAQLLAGARQYRQASELFASAAGAFKTGGHHFLWLIAFVNELLNRYRLGEFQDVINKCGEALLMSSSYRYETQGYNDVLNLPLGMCHYEQGRPGLAVKCLELAKACIDPMNLFHMHGLLELYLFRSYRIANDEPGMAEVMQGMQREFAHMPYGPAEQLLSMFDVFCGGSGMNGSGIESLQMEYHQCGENTQAFIIDALMLLQLAGYSDTITAEALEKRLEILKYTGFIPQLQATELYLAELYYRAGEQEKALPHLKEAVRLYREHGISASFLLLPVKVSALLSKLEPRLYNQIMKGRGGDKAEAVPPGQALSVREREIMALVMQGKSNEEIGKALYIGVGTIKWHTNNIFGKLGVKNRVQAIEKMRN